MKFWKYCAMVWLLMSSCSSSASSSGSWKISHHFPLSAASCGLRRLPRSRAASLAYAAARASLKPGGDATVGRHVLRPDVAPSRSARTSRRRAERQSEARIAADLLGPFAPAALPAAAAALAALHPQAEPVEREVDDRRRVEREQLAQDQPAHDRDAERPPQLVAHARCRAPAAARRGWRPSSSS